MRRCGSCEFIGYACGMLIRALPLVAAAAPLLALTLAHWLGAEGGQVPACIPYLDGCTSISATGRQSPGSFVFRAVLLPLASVQVVIWYFVFAWLKGPTSSQYQKPATLIFAAGLISAIALVLYVTFLGTREPVYELMRRFGIYFYFLGAAIAQLLTSIRVFSESKRCDDTALRRIASTMLLLCLIPFALGILNFSLKVVLENADFAQNRIAWLVILSMHLWFVALYFAWRATGFEVSVKGLDQRLSVRTRSSVSDSRNEIRSPRSAAESSKPRINSDL